MLMRAAGIPARLVSGFRGGTTVALTDFIIVKRSDAHAWVEIWDKTKGWHKVDPKDIVLPPEKKPETQKLEKTNESMVIKTQDKQFLHISGATKLYISGATENEKKIEKPEPKTDPEKSLPDFSSLFGGIKKWIINYNPDRQTEILKGAGMEEGDWLDLLLIGAAGILLILCVYLSAAWWHGKKKTDKVMRSWKIFCNRMQKLGITKGPQECPGDYLVRIGSEKSELEAAARNIIGRYIDIRYGNNNSKESQVLFRRQVSRFTSMT